jgi:putative membrane protein
VDIRSKFSEEDLNRIKAAVRQAESIISGEIVPVIVNRSANYPIASYKAAAIFSSLAFVAIVAIDRYMNVEETIFYDPLTMFLIVVAIGLLGVALTNLVQPLKRMLVAQDDLDLATRQRAETAFLEEEVFNTRHRTGIMIFVSFFEHEVIVMADRGISKVVDQKEWDDMVSQLTAMISEGKIVIGLEEAIHRCGEILQAKGFAKTNDDINELRDDLRIDDK